MSSPQTSTPVIESGMRVPPVSADVARPTGSRLPRSAPFRSQTAARRLDTSGCASSHSIICIAPIGFP
jgi:hypothetical protein